MSSGSTFLDIASCTASATDFGVSSQIRQKRLSKYSSRPPKERVLDNGQPGKHIFGVVDSRLQPLKGTNRYGSDYTNPQPPPWRGEASCSRTDCD